MFECLAGEKQKNGEQRSAAAVEVRTQSRETRSKIVTNCHLIGHNLSLCSALLKQARSGCDEPLSPTLVTRIQGTLASLGADLQFRLKTEVAPNQ